MPLRADCKRLSRLAMTTSSNLSIIVHSHITQLMYLCAVANGDSQPTFLVHKETQK